MGLKKPVNIPSFIETGTYKGTGQYGANNPNIITPHKVSPQIVIIHHPTSGGVGGVPWAKGLTKACSAIGTTSNIVTLTWGEDGSVSWYHTGNAGAQLNIKDIDYVYTLIGEPL